VSSVATLQPAVVVFREEQYFDWRVYVAIGLLEVLVALALVHGRARSVELVLALVAALVLGMFVVVSLLYMTTEVMPSHLRVWFGWAPVYRRTVPIGSIRRIEVVTYRPIADFGFWGPWPGRDGTRAFTARGTRAVQIELADESKLLIGSQRPEALATALETALRPHV
jgi:hypothetical protein